MRFTLPPKLVFVAIVLTLGSGIVQSTIAVDFAQCIADIRNGTYGSSGGVDVHGQPVEVSQAVGMTYGLCKRACGTGPTPFDFSEFAKRFSAWLLPWLALLSRLPFGAKRRVDNLMSMLLAVGSPTLAAYSVTLTLLNRRWVARHFSGIKYPNVDKAFRVMISLQQAPLQITNERSLLSSLVVLPQNDKWWEKLEEQLDYTHTWSISASAAIAWVFVAYIFTVINGFSSLKDEPSANMSDGQAVGSLWLWLLPVVISWLQISPKCDNERLTKAMSRANEFAYVVNRETGRPSLASDISKHRALTLYSEELDPIYDDEECTAPIYNYARFLSFIRAVDGVASAFRSASNKAYCNESVDGVAWRDQEKDDNGHRIHYGNRRGTAKQVDEYCATGEDVRRRHLGSDILSRFLLASSAGLLLQWCTTGAAIIILWYTPTVGLGCRSATFFIYAGASTLVWMLLVTSSFLTYHYSPRHQHSTRSTNWKHVARALAIMLRRLGKSLAALNAVWIVVACVLQFASFYDRCYCNSSTISLGNRAYSVVLTQASDVWTTWIGGVAFACGSAILFIIFVNIFVNP